MIDTQVAAASRLRSLAERTARALARYRDVVAIALLGSVSRGNAHPDSDVDLLVLMRDFARPSRLARRVPPTLRSERLSIMCYSAERWNDEVDRGTLFLHHVRLEGRTLYDPLGVLRAGLAALTDRPPDVTAEVQRQLRRLRLYRDLTRLNGQHQFALADLYGIGKSTAIARCAELGEMTFVKEEALRLLATRRPELAESVETITRLRPFYDAARNRTVALPFRPVHADKEVRRALAAIERLARD